MVVARERDYHHCAWTSPSPASDSMPSPELSHRVDQKPGARQFQIHAGGATGIDLSSDVTQVLAHTHPYHLPALGPSADDVAMLSQLGQSSSILLEHGQIILFGPGGTIAWR